MKDYWGFKEKLDRLASKYNRPSFIESDPISIPHLFSNKEDREISAFLVATIAWGQRVTILKNGRRLMELMDMAPAAFIRSFSQDDLKPFAGFVHRTFNYTDLEVFLYSLKNIYQRHGGLEASFMTGYMQNQNVKEAIVCLREVFFEVPHPRRTCKHVSNPQTGASAKRLNMFLRWMVRQDNAGVDFGLWEQISPAHLYCPLDVHSGRVARQFGLLKREQNDWSAVEELTANLCKLNPDDPVIYDFALFGMGVFGE